MTGKKGHFSEATHRVLVAQRQPLIPTGATVIFVGDGEFDGTDLQATLDGDGWQYVCRTAANTRLWAGAVCLTWADIGLAPNEAVYIQPARMTARQYGPLLALALWEADHQAPLYLVSNLSDPNIALDWYRRRFRIETFFSDQKSRGFHLHQSHVSDPKRLARLLIAACLAYLWLVYLGVVAIRDGWLRQGHRTKRCDLSLFQLGLRFLARCLKEHLPVLVAFHPPPQALL